MLSVFFWFFETSLKTSESFFVKDSLLYASIFKWLKELNNSPLLKRSNKFKNPSAISSVSAWETTIPELVCRITSAATPVGLTTARIGFLARIYSNNLPVTFTEAIDLFDAVIQLQPEGNKIHIRVVKGAKEDPAQSVLLLDPESLLVIDGWKMF